MSEENTSLTDGTPVATIDFYGAEWCRDCRRSKKLLDNLGVSYTYYDLEADEAAVEQARENVARTPWSDRMEVERLDIRKAPEEWNGCFDAIVSNPPYFVESVKCPQAQRNTARHTDELDFDTLLSKVSVLLSEKGSFSVVLPATASADIPGR